jgi:hypothetical protein
MPEMTIANAKCFIIGSPQSVGNPCLGNKVGLIAVVIL